MSGVQTGTQEQGAGAQGAQGATQGTGAGAQGAGTQGATQGTGASTGTAGTQGGAQGGEDSFLASLPPEAQNYIRNLRDEAAAKRVRAKELEAEVAKRDAEKRAAEEKELADKQEWKTLADRRAAEAEEHKRKLQTLEAEVAAYNKDLETEVASLRTELGEEVVKGLELDAMPLRQRKGVLLALKRARGAQGADTPPEVKVPAQPKTGAQVGTGVDISVEREKIYADRSLSPQAKIAALNELDKKYGKK